MNTHYQKGMLVLLAFMSSHALAMDKSPSPSHFYVGGTLGVAGLMDKESTSNPINDTHYLGAPGAIGGLFIGYDFHLQDQWMLGLEGFADVTNISVADNQNYAPLTSYTVNMRHDAGIRLLPAYAMTPDTAVHIVLGYANGNFKINDNGNYGIVNKTFSKSGFQTGLGVEICLGKQLMLRSDILYTIYSSETSNGVTTTTTPPTTQPYHNRFSTLEGGLSLVYKV